MTKENPIHILIIGGGVGGLALAQLLEANPGVQCSVFDRDENAAARHHKWSVSLSTCLPVLGPRLGPRLGSFVNASNTRASGLMDSGAILDWKTGEKRVKWGRESPGPGYFILANRAKVRNFFLHGIQMQWNKKFTHYEEDANGVTAYFEDGTQARGDILVGVDGSNSRVRNQLLKDLTDISTKARPYAVIAAEFPTTTAQHESLSKQSESFAMTMDNGSILHTGLQEPLPSASEYNFSKDKGPAKYYYHLYIPDPVAATLNADHTAAKGKVFWTQTASAKELREKALEFTKHWRGAVREVVELAQEEHMLIPPFLLRDWCPPEKLELPRGRVTLMGDAAHQMIPFRGTGANTAILDAIELAEVIDTITLPPSARPKGPPFGPPGGAGGLPGNGPPGISGPPGGAPGSGPPAGISGPSSGNAPDSSSGGPPTSGPLLGVAGGVPPSHPPGPPATIPGGHPASIGPQQTPIKLLPRPDLPSLQNALDAYWATVLPRGREAVLASRHALETDPNGDMTVQMISRAMSGGGPPPGVGGPPGGPPGGPGGPPMGAFGAKLGGPPSGTGGPPTGAAGDMDGMEQDAKRSLMWRG